MLAVYIASALFGGCVLVGSWLLDHEDAHDAPHDLHDEVAHPSAHLGVLGTLLRLRFWTFGLTFFGLAGSLIHVLGGPALRQHTPWIAGLVGLGAGFTAARLLGRLFASSPGAIAEAQSHVGREGLLLLPASPGQRGKVRLELSNGAALDLLAEAQDNESLPLGEKVMVLEIRESVAVVARSPLQKGKS